jgi:hypothetical protein
VSLTVPRGRTAACLAGLTCAAAVLAGPTVSPAVAKGAPVAGPGQRYFLSDAASGAARYVLDYGSARDETWVGDWDGDGADTLAVRRGNTFHLRDENASGVADRTLAYGNPGDAVLVGDWDGDGVDTFAVRRGTRFLLRNSASAGRAEVELTYGNPGDVVLVGDWDGDGADSLGVRRGNRYFLRNALSTGVADRTVVYGNPGDAVLVGDWDGDGADSLGVRRGNRYFLRDALSDGVADRVVHYGNPGDAVLVGDWDGDGAATLGVRRAVPASVPLPRTEPAQRAVRNGLPSYVDEGDLVNIGRGVPFYVDPPNIWVQATDWAPDGRTSALVTGSDDGTADGRLYVVDEVRGTYRDVAAADGNRPSFSPDGFHVALAVSGDVVVVDVATGRVVRRLTDTPGTLERNPDWSPTGASVAFETPDGVHVVAASGGQPSRRWMAGARHPDHSPDGRRISYLDAAQRLRHADARTGAGVADTGIDAWQAVWSPDGTAFLFIDLDTTRATIATVQGRVLVDHPDLPQGSEPHWGVSWQPAP